MSVWNANVVGVQKAVKDLSGTQSGTFSYLDAGGEQTVDILATANRHYIKSIWLDLVNMTQNGTIKVYYKIDGTTFREFISQDFTVATDPDGVLVRCGFGIEANLKITYTEGGDEGAARAIPYSIDYTEQE